MGQCGMGCRCRIEKHEASLFVVDESDDTDGTTRRTPSEMC